MGRLVDGFSKWHKGTCENRKLCRTLWGWLKHTNTTSATLKTMQNLYTVKLTDLEISTILYYIEGGVQGTPEEEIEPEVYSIFEKLENVKA